MGHVCQDASKPVLDYSDIPLYFRYMFIGLGRVQLSSILFYQLMPQGFEFVVCKNCLDLEPVHAVIGDCFVNGEEYGGFLSVREGLYGGEHDSPRYTREEWRPIDEEDVDT